MTLPKTLLIVAALVMVGCGQRKYQRYEVTAKPIDVNPRDSVFFKDAVFYFPEFIDGEYKSIDFSEGYRIVTIDACEYIVYTHGSSYSIIHKANCKNHDIKQ
jgi:hypothetical protein